VRVLVYRGDLIASKRDVLVIHTVSCLLRYGHAEPATFATAVRRFRVLAATDDVELKHRENGKTLSGDHQKSYRRRLLLDRKLRCRREAT